MSLLVIFRRLNFLFFCCRNGVKKFIKPVNSFSFMVSSGCLGKASSSATTPSDALPKHKPAVRVQSFNNGGQSMCSEFSGNKSVRRERNGTQKQSSPEKRTNFM